MARPLLALLALTSTLPQLLLGRLTEHWTEKEAFEKADLVVIAKVASTRSIDERIVLSNVQPQTEVFGLETDFETCIVLKGRKDIRKFTLHHYEAHEQFTNGPLLIDIPKGKHPTYLLFLIEESDGRYAPATGQTDPAGSSAFRLLAASARGFAAPEPLVACAQSETHPTNGRMAHRWTYQEMFDNADVVAIAEWNSAKDINEHTRLGDVNPPVRVVGVVTDFETDLVLKGPAPPKNLEVQHFRVQNKGDANRESASGLINITAPMHGDDGREYPGGGTFLLLLRKGLNDRFAPVTGQTDPALYSVLQVLPAFGD